MYLYIVCICVGSGGQKKTYGSLNCPTMWDPMIKLEFRSSGLEVSGFTYWAIYPAPIIYFY